MGKKKGGRYIKNRELLRGKNTLPLADGVNEDSLVKTAKQQKKLLKDSAVESIENQKNGCRIPKEGATEYFKNNPVSKPEKAPEPKKIVAKGTILKKAAGKFLVRLVPVVGTAITVKELYDFGKEIKETIIDAPPVQEQLQKLYEENPGQFPEPPKIENYFDDSFDLKRTEKEWVASVVNEKFEELNVDEVTNISNEEMDNLVFTIDEVDWPMNEPIKFSGEEKENLMAEMRGFEDVKKPFFLEELVISDPEPFEIDIGDPSIDSSDGSADGGADGGGDGGGSGGGAGD